MKTRKAKLRVAAIAGAAVVAVGLTTVTHFANAAEQQKAAPTAVAINLPANIRQAIQAVHPGPGFVPIAAYQVGLLDSGPFATRGTQTYTCADTGTWPAGSTPEADLIKLIGSGPQHIHHYAGPKWSEQVNGVDASTVKAVLPPLATDPQDDTLAWLLLDVTHEGPAGAMDRVARINRVLTNEGLPTTATCTPGEKTTVDYGAVYVFWAAA